MEFKAHISRAIELVGSQTALAQKSGLSQQGISWLLNDAPTISLQAALAIEAATEGQVTRADLRPDIKWFTNVTPSADDDVANKNHQPPGTEAA